MSDKLPEKLTPEQVIEAVVTVARSYGYGLGLVATMHNGRLALNVTRSLLEAGVNIELVAEELAPSEK